MYNPNNVNPPVNLHDSERDSELEKFIRNKYQYKTLMSMQGSRAPPPSSRDRYKSSGLGWERMEVGEEKPKEHLTVAPPPRSSSASHPRAASPALTTKSPAPASISPAPPTPSPSIPSYSPAPPAATQPRPLQMLAPSPQPPLQMLAPSPNPPLQMLSPSPNPPLQMLSPSAGMSMQPLQNNFMPGYPSSAYSGSMPSSPYQMTSNLQPSMTNSNPVWQDMAAIQSGPTMPAFQPLMPTGISLQPQMTNSYNPMQGAPTGWGSTGGMMQGVTMAQSPMMMTTSYQPAMNGYQQSNGMTGLQPMYTQNQPMYMMQQQQQQQQPGQQMMYSPGTQQQQQQQIMQPAPMQGMNQMTWMQQGGGYSNGQWQG